MAVYVVNLCLLRFALPLALAAAAILRQNGLSLVYLILLLISPAIPLPASDFHRGHASRFIKAVLILSLTVCVSQLVFQITLLSLPPYGHFLVNCDLLEQSLRHLGLVRLNGISAQDGVRLLLPDALVLLASFATHLVSSKLGEPSNSLPGTSAEQASPPGGAIFGPRFIHFLGAMGKYVVLAALCLAGAARPSVPGAIYYVSFIFWATWWAWWRNLSKSFARVCQVALAPLVAIHLLVLFTYQTQWPQELIPPDHQFARLMGLTALVVTSCDDPRSVTMSTNLEWASFANPFLLLFLYFSLVFESQILLSSSSYQLHGGREGVLPAFSPPQGGQVSWNGAVRGGVGAATSLPPSSPPRSSHPNPSSGLSRRRTIPWSRAASIRVRGRHVVEIAELKREEYGEEKMEIDPETGYSHLGSFDEGTPLMHTGRTGRMGGTRKLGSKYSATAASVRLKKGDTSSLTQDATGSVIWAHAPSSDGMDAEPEKTTEEINMQQLDNVNTGIEDIEMDSGPLEQIVDAVISIFQIITRSSYIATNIIMMAWSITYHSWLTFVLLLWASVLWMIPNQRRSLLHCSPFLVAYAEFLLLAQYVYGMNLTNDELPPAVEGINLAQIGFIKYTHLPFKPILVKSLYTVMFWITLRQYSQELWELKNAASTVVGVTAEPFVISVTTATSQELHHPETVDETAVSFDGSLQTMMHRFGAFLKSFLTKFWIWVVAIMLCVIGLGGAQVVVYRIVYMALFLIFVLTFQLSYAAWRKMMYGFWLTVIVYSMLCLVLIYTYQFDNFPDYWQNYTGIPIELQHDIGLEVFDTGALFVRLLTPTFFVIITVIQLHYFHKDFLAISDIRHRNPTLNAPQINTTAPAAEEVENDIKKEIRIDPTIANNESLAPIGSQKLKQSLSLKDMRKISYVAFMKMTRNSKILITQTIEICWKFFELHMVKIVFLSFVLMAVCDVCALHLAFIVLSVVALPCGKKIQSIIIHLSSALTSVLLLSKMIYQIEYIRHEQWEANCTGLPSLNSTNDYVGNVEYTMNNADWIGFKKTTHLPDLLKGYIGLILVCTLHAVVCIRQKHVRRALGVGPTPPTTPISSASVESSTYWARQERDILFPGVDRSVADNDITTCIKFLLNYGFYKFGVEICLITTVAVVGTRMDVYSIVYSIWLCHLVHLSGRMGRGPKGAGGTGWGGGREALARVWTCFLLTIAILLPVQYVFAVGIPPGLCVDFPWYRDERLRRLQDWMFLPDYVHSPRAYKLVCDFILLLLVCQQHTVFRAERGPNSISHPGGSNRETSLDVDDSGLNPVPDFISNVRSWLDVVKRVVLSSFFWVSLAVVFLAGTNRVNLFALGYLAGSFIFLWQGNDFYLRPMNTILNWWNMLLGYNVTVILCKSLIQMLGCVFIKDLQIFACWLVQLLGIACIKKFRDESSRAGVIDPKECVVPREDTGLAWDGVCFAFLLLQRRLFRSHYFLRVVDETKAQTILASRGAELIEQLSKRQIREQQDLERQVLEKIKHKMERIKATHQRRQDTFFREPASHYDVQPSSRLSSPSLCPSHVKVTAATDAGHVSPQGFHTPIEDDGTDTAPPSPTPSVSPSHPPRPIPIVPSQPFGGLPVPPSHRRSLSQTMQVLATTTTTTTNTSGAPTPSSAAFTISLDGYLEGQRISISSPLSSDMVLPLSQTPRRYQLSRRRRPRPASFPPPPNDLDYYGAEEDDESFPVFSPPPYDALGMEVSHGAEPSTCVGPRDGHTSRGSRGARGSISNPPIGPPWLPPLASTTPGHSFSISPAQSHHTCEHIGEEYRNWRHGIHRRSAQEAVRSGDYFMFEEYDDDEEEEIMALRQSIRSIEEEEDDDEEGDTVDGETGPKSRRRRFTLSKLLSSAMKTDVEQAADMALMSHQDYAEAGESTRRDEGGEEVEDEPTISNWRRSSLGVAPDPSLAARHRSFQGTRSRRSSSLSARSDHGLQQPSSSVSVRSSFQSSRIPPLSEEEEPQMGGTSATTTPTHGKGPSAVVYQAAKDEPPGRGRDKRGPDDGGGEDPGDLPPDGLASGSGEGDGARRTWAYVKFVWALIESLMVSATRWLNRFSRDYRYIARCLAREKKLLKEKSGFREGMRTGSAMIWEPRPVVVASWKTRSGIQRESTGVSGKASVAETKVNLEERMRSKMYDEMEGSHDDNWESDDDVNEERQRDECETEDEIEKEGKLVPKIRIWAASLEKGLEPPSVGGSPALVSLEAIEAEDGRKGLGAQEEASTFGGGRSPAACLFLAIWYAVISHSELVCYFTVFLHQIKSASLLSIPLPLMVFLWGTLSVPRPSKTFWVTIIAYTEVMVLIKCMFQFDYLPWNQQAIPENLPFFPPRIIGIERKKRYAVFDLTLLLVVFFHRFMLKSLGLWKSTNGYDAYMEDERGSLNRGGSGSSTSNDDSPSKKTISVKNRSITDSIAAEKATLSEVDTEGPTTQCGDLVVVRTRVQESLKHFPRVVSLAASKYLSSIKSFVYQLLEPTTRVTADVYAYMFMCDFFNFMVVIFGFAAFGTVEHGEKFIESDDYSNDLDDEDVQTQQGDGGVSAYLEENKVPVPFLVMLILQFGLMIIDRALFLRKYILGKILFQVLIVVGVHIWMFIVLPGVTERQFNAALPPQMWYVVKCLYLLLSAYQIRSGYPTRILGNFLCKKYNYVNMFLFKGFMAIPFLFELRALMDWIWTDTSMTLSDWLKLEDIFAHIFQLKCQRRVEKEYPQPRGERKRPLSKYVVGGGFLLGIIAVIWFPLVLFALGSTVGEANLPHDVSLELRVGAYQPVFRMSAQNNSLLRFTERNWNSFGSVYKKDRVAQTFLSNYDWQDVAVAKLSGNSTATWTVSPPAKNQMIQEVLSDKPILVTLTWAISRKAPNPDSSGVGTDSRTITMEAEMDVAESGVTKRVRNPMRDRLAAMLDGNETISPVILPSMLPKFLKVANKGKASPVPQLMRLMVSAGEYGEWWGIKVEGDGTSEGPQFRDLSLKFRHGSMVEWWELGEVCSDTIYSAVLSHLPFHDDVNPNTGDCSYLTIFTFNDKAFPAGLSFLSGAGIIGLYTTMVLVASKFVRSYFTGISVTIMFDDMPNVDRILQLCLDIYLVRESGELDLEEDLFAKLVFLYRSPETLIKWTRPKGESIEAAPGQEGPSPGGGASTSRDTIARRARPEEDDDDDDDDPDDEPDDDAVALVLMDDSSAVAPRAQPERS